MDSLDQKLDEMLRKTEAPVGDDGFSEGVVNRLPKRRLNREKCRSWTLAGAAAMGSILTLLLAPPIETAFRLFEILGAYRIWMLAFFLVLIILTLPSAWLLYSRLVGNSRNPEFSHPGAIFRSRMSKY